MEGPTAYKFSKAIQRKNWLLFAAAGKIYVFNYLH